MKLQSIKRQLSRVIELLELSEESMYSSQTPEEIIEILSDFLKIINEFNLDKELSKLQYLFAPYRKHTRNINM